MSHIPISLSAIGLSTLIVAHPLVGSPGPAAPWGAPSGSTSISALLAFAAVDGELEVVCDERSPGPALRGPAADEELRALYESGQPYMDFLGRATRRAELWHGNTERAGAIDPALVERARAVEGTWHLLAITVDACSDSVSTIPYLAELVDRVEGLDLRLVDPVAGRAIMESHPTPDGRAATPTVLLLDDAFDEVGCFIERPPTLQTWILDNDQLSSQEVYERKMDWYAEDAGHETVETFVRMLEAASVGQSVCG